MNCRKLFIIVSMLFAASVVQAQEQSKFRFGLKGALNLGWSKAESKNIGGNGMALGYAYGLMGDYYFQKNYALSTEFLFSHVHNKFQFEQPMYQSSDVDNNGKIDTFNLVSARFRSQYLQIPLSMKFRTKEIGYLTYWAQFGVGPGFLISAKADYEGVEPVGDYEDLPVNDKSSDVYHLADVKTGASFDDKVFFFRFPVIIGAGIDYKMAGNASLHLGLRIENSFSDVFLKDDAVKLNNNLISLSTGVFF